MIPIQDKLFETLNAEQNKHGFITTQTNQPLTQTAYRRTWQRISKTINLYGATPHILRHTFATLAASEMDPKTLQAIMGHANISTTMNRYVHSRLQKITEASKIINTMYGT